MGDLKEVKESVDCTPVFVASGVDEKNLPLYKGIADGIILGTRIKKDNDTEAPIDPDKLNRFMEIARKTWSE